jgi:hypothetical protein
MYNGGPFTKYSFEIRVRVGLLTDGQEVQFFYDYLGFVVNRANLSPDEKTLYDNDISNWFWKHGQAGIFDTSTVITPTNWYGKQEVFEFEFIVVDNPSFQKIFDNLKIISNDAEPDSFEFSVVGDGYNVDKTTLPLYQSDDGSYTSQASKDGITTYQKGKSLKQYGRRLGNMEYKEDLWDIEIKPFRNYKGTGPTAKLIETRIRDKYVRIRVRYSGVKLAVITALQTMFTRSYA